MIPPASAVLADEGMDATAGVQPLAATVGVLRRLALRALGPMYRPEHSQFVFRVRLHDGRIVSEGLSRRYTAITLIGLAGEEEGTSREILAGQSAEAVCERLIHDLDGTTNLGDIALTCWAAHAVGCSDSRARRQLFAFEPQRQPCSVVELAWTLTALVSARSADVERLRAEVAQRLMGLFDETSQLFPHLTDPRRRLRAHIACFADQVYPALALSRYAAVCGDERALSMALKVARHLCSLQGPDGQWWWHYDVRSGSVIEGYPVYAVHQDGMAPMALAAVQDVAHVDFSKPVRRGLDWLLHAPELQERSLIDEGRGFIWRKVARREPAKASRYLQALATSVRAGSTWPGLDRMFPPGTIDYECRPYHLGWLLYAWPGTHPDRSA